MERIFHVKRKKTGTTFERSKPQRGRNIGSYSKGVSTPKSLIEDRRRLMVLIALLVILPPVGIVCLWRSDLFRVPVRGVITFAAFWLMVLYFSLMIPGKTPTAMQPDLKRPPAVTEYSPSSAMYQQAE